MRKGRWQIATGAMAALLACGTAHAADEEIQVYTDDILPPGDFGLDLHTNFVATGDLTNDYIGQQQSLHRFRLTPEFGYALTRTIELGAYLPLTEIDSRGRFGVDGVKLRVKYIHPHAEQGWYWGANFEIGRVARKLDENPYNAELKGILGFNHGRWAGAFNTNIDFKVAGPASSPASLQLAAQLFYSISKRLSVGVETYNGAGELRALGHFGSSEQASFIAINRAFGRWDLNLGVGRGYGTNADHLIVKAIISVPIGRRHA
jgi:hypothetical protein